MFTLRAEFNFLGNGLCILDNAMTMDLVAVDFNIEELVVSWDSITDVKVNGPTMESVVVDSNEELEEEGVTATTESVTVDSNEELEEEGVAVTTE